MSLKMLSSYLIRLIGCIVIVSIIAGVCIGIRPAIVDYEPILVEMHGTFSQEQNIKVYYARDITDSFDKSRMQEFHVNAGDSQVQFEVQKLDKMKKIKLEFERNVGNTVLTDIKVSCGEQSEKLNKMNKFKPGNMTSLLIDGEKMIFSSSQVTPSVEYTDTFNVRTSGHVWFFPVNKYSLFLAGLLLFSGFWWLLTVVTKINRDIEAAFKR